MKDKVGTPCSLVHMGCSQAADKEKEPLALLQLTRTQIQNTDLDHFLEEMGGL
jgi:hypothetical protein